MVKRIPKGDHVARIICESCGTIHYSNPNMVVGCLITNEKGQVMLAKRGIEPRKGFWNLPCGFMENYETIEQGALREVHEETGAHVKIEYLLTIYSVTHANQVYAIFKASLEQSEYYTTEESTEIDFFDEKEIPWDDVAFSSNEFALRAHFENEKTGKRGIRLGEYVKA